MGQSTGVTEGEQAPQRGLFLLLRTNGFGWLLTNSFFSGFGNILEILAVGWLVLDKTDSPFLVGLVTALRGVGLVFLAPLGGVIADKVDRRKLLTLVTLANAVNTLIMGLLIITDVVTLWQIMLLVGLQGLTWSIRMPVRNTLAYDLVGRRRALNAVSANFLAMQSTRIVGPVTAGLIISGYGVGEAYLVASASHFVSIGALLLVPRPPSSYVGGGSTLHNLREGLAHVIGNGPVRSLFSLVLVTEALGFSYQAMLPVMARDFLHVGATGLGFLAAGFGAGAVVAAFVITNLGDFKSKGWLLVGGAFCFGLFLVLFAFSRSYPLSIALLALAGASGVAYDSSAAALLQMLVPDNMRGRVMGVYGSFIGTSPMGGLQAGAVAALVSAPFAVGLGGTLVALNALRLVRLAPRMPEMEAQAREEAAAAEEGKI